MPTKMQRRFEPGTIKLATAIANLGLGMEAEYNKNNIENRSSQGVEDSGEANKENTYSVRQVSKISLVMNGLKDFSK